MTKKMNKYIDAEKLIASLNKTMQSYKSQMVDPRKYPIDHIDLMAFLAREYQAIIANVTSLQQEQQEVDFEKELDRIWFDNKFGDRFDNSAVDFANVREICRHFYELRHNARKED